MTELFADVAHSHCSFHGLILLVSYFLFGARFYWWLVLYQLSTCARSHVVESVDIDSTLSILVGLYEVSMAVVYFYVAKRVKVGLYEA